MGEVIGSYKHYSSHSILFAKAMDNQPEKYIHIGVHSTHTHAVIPTNLGKVGGTPLARNGASIAPFHANGQRPHLDLHPDTHTQPQNKT